MEKNAEMIANIDPFGPWALAMEVNCMYSGKIYHVTDAKYFLGPLMVSKSVQ
jgi:hypothetical protein